MHELLDTLGMHFDATRELLLAGLILGRAMPMIFTTPFLGGQQLPPEVKIAMGALFAVIAWPLARASIVGPTPMFAYEFVALMLKESFIGLVMGLTSAHIFHAVETAGRFIDTARGAAMSEVMVPTSKARATPIGNMYHQILLIVFVALGGHHIFLETFFFSFSTLPLTGGIDLTPGLAPMALHSIRLAGDVLAIATILSAPAIAATFITDLVFGILNRVAPQLNAYFMAMPVKAMGGLALVLVSLHPVLGRMIHYTQETLAAVRVALGLLAVH